MEGTPPKGRAARLVDELMANPLTPEEKQAMWPKLPALRLREDAPAVEVNAATPIRALLERLANQAGDMMALREEGADVGAVVLPVARYLDLVAKEMALNPHGTAVSHPDGSFGPTAETMEAAHVEEVDPQTRADTSR